MLYDILSDQLLGNTLVQDAGVEADTRSVTLLITLQVDKMQVILNSPVAKIDFGKVQD